MVFSSIAPAVPPFSVQAVFKNKKVRLSEYKSVGRNRSALRLFPFLLTSVGGYTTHLSRQRCHAKRRQRGGGFRLVPVVTSSVDFAPAFSSKTACGRPPSTCSKGNNGRRRRSVRVFVQHVGGKRYFCVVTFPAGIVEFGLEGNC